MLIGECRAMVADISTAAVVVLAHRGTIRENIENCDKIKMSEEVKVAIPSCFYKGNDSI